MTSFSPYLPYSGDRLLENKWRNYEINELGRRSHLRTMDRIKLTFQLITESMNIFGLNEEEYQLIESFGPLHDVYELLREKKLGLFEKLPVIVQSARLPE